MRFGCSSYWFHRKRGISLHLGFFGKHSPLTYYQRHAFASTNKAISQPSDIITDEGDHLSAHIYLSDDTGLLSTSRILPLRVGLGSGDTQLDHYTCQLKTQRFQEWCDFRKRIQFWHAVTLIHEFN